MASDGTTPINGSGTRVLRMIDHDHDEPSLPDQQELPQDAPAANDSVPSKPTTDAHGRILNPRSCVTCRKRKVKCDKTHPCANCKRAQIECIFPSPGRAPRKARKIGEGRDKELIERLRRLEGVVKGLGVDLPKEDGDGDRRKEDANGRKEDESTAGAEADAGERAAQRRKSSVAASVRNTNSASNGGAVDQVNGQAKPPQRKQRGNSESREDSDWRRDHLKGHLDNSFGRLVINEGKSRYINNSFWANLSNEVEDLKGILNQSSDEEDETIAGSQNHQLGAHQGFVFGFSSQNVDMLSLHPLPHQIPLYWQTYKENVDPLVKVLHVPTIEPTILSAASHLSHLSRGFEALLFSIYYGAVTSLNPLDCHARLGEEKPLLLSRYRFAIEQALARANFLVTEEVIVLQAFSIFLMCLRRNSDARVIWTLTGLVVRIAQTLGVHRDGVHFGLTPFEIETRRRLWWQVCILDTRASEDHGCDPTIIEQTFDTKMPLNINDADITPAMRDFPPERQGCTDMSFCLIRFEVTNTFRRINYTPPSAPRPCMEKFASFTLEDKERWITECHQRLEERYLKDCDMSVPLFWVTATVARLMMSKMWLMVYHPFQRQDGGASLPEETKDKLFITSLENIEYSILLSTEARTMKWGWLFKTYMQWHALAFMLSELCHRTTGDLIERAWVAVEKTRDGHWGDVTDEDDTGSHLWRPLKKLYRKAKEARRHGLQEEQLVKQRTSGAAPARTYSPNANPMFGHPQRPTVVRAPLSRAQIQRFTNGPVYGERPLDSHEMLKSPRLRQLGDEQVDYMDITQAPATGSLPAPDTSVLDGAQLNGLGANSHFAGDGTQLFSPKARQSAARSFPKQSSIPDFDAMDLSNPELASTLMPTYANAPAFPPSAPAAQNSTAQRIPSLDSNLDPLMDTSGDLNWESWDQLVRQIGMDVDSGAGHESWQDPGWESGAFGPPDGWTPNGGAGSNGANMRMGMGMGGGDWF